MAANSRRMGRLELEVMFGFSLEMCSVCKFRFRGGTENCHLKAQQKLLVPRKTKLCWFR